MTLLNKYLVGMELSVQRILRPMLMGILALILHIITHITKQTKNRVLDLSEFSVSHGEHSHLLPKHLKTRAIYYSAHCPYLICHMSLCPLPLPYLPYILLLTALAYLPYSNTNYHYPRRLPTYK